ncbi:twin-arginine translocase subunit TatC [Paenibacillus agaridevorans]|nr:twin-arginine translocase subunit TatC [Paenibacillus agaridevorans]
MGQEKEMTLVDHLGDLRKVIIRSLSVVGVALVIGLVVASPLLDYLKAVPPASGIAWNVFSPWDAVGIYMKCALVIALAVSLPYVLHQVWGFVRPGLRPEEQYVALRYIPGAAALFLLGVAFAYFILFPMAYGFTSKMAQRMGLQETYGVIQYFTFMFNIILPTALLFQLPVVVLFLTRLGIVTPSLLRRMRKVAYLALVAIAVLVTPPDFISDFLVAIPLVVLYELSILLSARAYRQQQALEGQAAGENNVSSVQLG